MSLRVALVDHGDGVAFAGLRATLPGDWVVREDLGAAEALEEASVGGLDAVIAAPGPEGDALATLAAVQIARPDVLRALVVPADMPASEAAHREAAPGVQQVLRKPFGEGEVRATMRRLLAVRALLSDPALRAQLGRIDRLPTAPTSYLGLRMVMADDGRTMADAVAVVQRDPALNARVLRLANSALYARGRAITDLATAVSRIGLDGLAPLVLAGEVFNRFDRAEDAASERQALLSAAIAQAISPSPRVAGLAAGAALLADLGRLLPTSIALAATPAGEPWRNSPRPAQLGAALMALWGLPMEMVEAVAYHAVPSGLPGRGFDVTGVVHVARALAMGTPIDEAWLAGAGLADRVEQWKTRAADLAARAADGAG